jgi:hypothetical protein
MHNYTDGDILLTLKLLQTQPMGRKALAKTLALGEATVRTLFRRLESSEYITSTRQGQKITEKGITFLASYPSFTLPTPVNVGELTLSQYNMATLITNFSHCIKNGIQFRDAAIIAGATGATTILFKNQGFVFPHGNTLLPPDISSTLINQFSPAEGDVLIIATATTSQKAIRGISNCLSLLLQTETKNL